MSNDAATFADRLSKLRNSKGLSRAEIARRSEIGPETIRSYEEGRCSPTLKTLVAIARALEVPPADLLPPS